MRRSKELIGDRVVIGDGQFYPTNNKPLKQVNWYDQWMACVRICSAICQPQRPKLTWWLKYFTVQNVYNIYYFFTPNLLYNVPMGRFLGYTTPMPYHLGTIRYGWCNKKEDVVWELVLCPTTFATISGHVLWRRGVWFVV